MKSTILRISSLILLLALYTGCNSTLYDIVEIEEPVEIKPDIKAPESDIKSDKEENKTLTESTQPETTQPESTTKETSTESSRNESKFSDKDVISQKYVIQVGAFNSLSNASSCTRSAQKKLNNQDIYMKDYDDGLYKVRFGNFSSKSEAINYLGVVQSAGFMDSFVVEVSTVKVAK
jgi:cell division septation protein DedD